MNNPRNSQRRGSGGGRNGRGRSGDGPQGDPRPSGERGRGGAGPRGRGLGPQGRIHSPSPAAPRERRPEHRIQEAVSVPVTAAQLRTMLQGYGVNLDEGQADLLARFHSFLMDKNRSLNLTRIWNLQEVVIKHYLDCFLVPNLVDLPSPLLDIGTGPGFPGIPLKILDPKLHVILAEGVQKRVNFLKEARSLLGLEEGMDVIGRNIDRQFFYPVGGVITRAVESIPDTLRRVRNSLSEGGLAIFMKGPAVDEEKEIALKRFKDQYELVTDTSYRLPTTPYQRRLVVFKRIKADQEDPEVVLAETEEQD